MLKNVKEIDPTESKRIIDGGVHLWCCDWKRNETFEKICEKYSNFFSYGSVDIIVFDGYAPSTKDATHRNRSGTFSETVEIKNNNLAHQIDLPFCPTILTKQTSSNF